MLALGYPRIMRCQMIWAKAKYGGFFHEWQPSHYGGNWFISSCGRTYHWGRLSTIGPAMICKTCCESIVRDMSDDE